VWCSYVTRVLDVASRFEGFDLRKHSLVHRGHQDLLGVCRVGRGARHHVGDHQAAQMLLVSHRVFEGEQPAPRLAVEDEVAPVQAEGLPNLLHLVHEAVKLP
jgi:hypothetical protein